MGNANGPVYDRSRERGGLQREERKQVGPDGKGWSRALDARR